MSKPKLLWVGDAGCATGFERSTRYIVNALREHYDIVILGIGATGDPTPQYNGVPVYPAFPGGDAHGVGRIAAMVQGWEPKLIVIQQDPWNFTQYLDELEEAKLSHIPVVGIVAVDGLNCQVEGINRLAKAIFWTDFGRDQAILAGCTVPTAVVPLGVDREIYHPVPTAEARSFLQVPDQDVNDLFLVGNVNRNQPRKRLDLTLEAFAMWVHNFDVPKAMLYLHVAPTGDMGYNLKRLVHYYKLKGRVICRTPHQGAGDTERAVNITYNMLDALLSTTQGEGFGLTTLEAMAARKACIVPDWAALGSNGGWTDNGVALVSCPTHAATFGGEIDVIGGVACVEEIVAWLDLLYNDVTECAALAQRGYARACNPIFDWKNIGQRIVEELQEVQLG